MHTNESCTRIDTHIGIHLGGSQTAYKAAMIWHSIIVLYAARARQVDINYNL